MAKHLNLTRVLLLISLLWTLGLIMLGAWVRLHDAGLGCPDWPGCYGRITPPEAAHEIAHAERHFGGDVNPGKGWKEMIHRYAVGGYGLLLLLTCALLWRQRRQHALPAWLVLAPLAVLVFQALLGMWTVTLKLMPAVVTAHLLGGMSLLALLAALAARDTLAPLQPQRGLTLLATTALLLCIAQIALGGWVSSNYAALACNGFPACQGGFAPPPGLAEALRPDRALGLGADGQPLSIDHLAAIHWLHRLGALLLSLAIVLTLWRSWRIAPRHAALLLSALLLQVLLGVANVEFGLPLPLAVAHNGGAALLLIVLTTLVVRCRQEARHAEPFTRLSFSR
ncbi:COX15/CtaA family protein [Jeongeupia naejangsanensis]|uniref:COX15/CtaA family protein n=1 Tax=Jeongeupia naejangsanensis TaxID=613195 RepID=A0ABS2BQ72_9NEIS|nr:COX15/CtaA family protein [Jeongeupia naejangsanensis]MBM3117796.1 COX15/CtaA family protein [Jeongeupia naejangsanensis]